MKNIHLLSTDKPSRLHYYNHIIPLGLSKEYLKWKQGRNIYITSEEEIKEGDWTIYLGNLVKVASLEGKTFAKEYCKKIILTTDQDLIKDGVQAIDDEFLEWFVKNPSCESVEVSDYIKQIGWESDANGRDMILNKRFYEIFIPKEEPKQREVFLMNANETIDTRSIVEKMKPLQEQWQKDMEESLNTKQESILKCELCKTYPRLEGTNKCEGCCSVVRQVLEQDPRFKDNLLPDLRKEQETSSVGAENQIFKIVLDEKWRPNKVSMIETDNNSVLNKQETFEEAAERFSKKFLNNGQNSEFEAQAALLGVQFGAKWQQERSYSEEDMWEAYKASNTIFEDEIALRQEFEEWLEQFKKK